MCTDIYLSSIEGKHYLGRTQEYNINFDEKVANANKIKMYELVKTPQYEALNEK